MTVENTVSRRAFLASTPAAVVAAAATGQAAAPKKDPDDGPEVGPYYDPPMETTPLALQRLVVLARALKAASKEFHEEDHADCPGCVHCTAAYVAGDVAEIYGNVIECHLRDWINHRNAERLAERLSPLVDNLVKHCQRDAA